MSEIYKALGAAQELIRQLELYHELGETAKNILRSKGYGVVGQDILATANLVPDCGSQSANGRCDRKLQHMEKLEARVKQLEEILGRTYNAFAPGFFTCTSAKPEFSIEVKFNVLEQAQECYSALIDQLCLVRDLRCGLLNKDELTTINP